MKKVYCLLGFTFLFNVSLLAQDEGLIVKRERLARDKGIFLGLGPSFTLGKNIGDYSVGFNIEVGYLKRVNRVLSIGPSLSYVNFKYDPEVTNVNGGAYVGIGDPNDWESKYPISNLEYIYGYVLTLEGGDLTLTSFAVNFKLNFLPVMDASKISIYGFAKPFITSVSRKEVKGSDVRYTYEIYEDNNGTTTIYDDVLYYNLGDETWYPDGFLSEWGSDSYEALKSENTVTGGIFIGPGIEIMPARKISIYAQAAFGYTFPVTYVSTKSYESTTDSYVDENFPMAKKGFPSVSVQFGISFNF